MTQPIPSDPRTTNPVAVPLTAPWLRTFWGTLQRLDRSKINSNGMALRNSLAVAVPLAIGIAIGQPVGAVTVATGALNVAYADGSDPYPHRARRMLTWSLLGALAVFLGCITGRYHLLAVIVASVWAIGAGMMVAISTRAADLGLNTLVALIVYAARGATSPKWALLIGLGVLAGGLLQTAVTLLLWPVRRYTLERAVLAKVFFKLADSVETEPDNLLAAPLQQATEGEVQDTLSSLGRDHSVEGERFRLLFDQAQRLHFSIDAVARLRTLQDSEQSNSRERAEKLLALTGQILTSVAEGVARDQVPARQASLLEQLHEALSAAQTNKTSSWEAGDFANAADILGGQLRLVTQLSGGATTAGADEFAKHELAPPLKLRVRGWVATVTANLRWSSPALRHALRLAVCVAIGDAMGRAINTQRNYWLAMTVAVVLKPDFTTTVSRGVLRLAGTFVGLLLATALSYALPAGAFTQLLLVGGFTFLLRSIGPANYGLFSVAISGLIVFLIGTTGVPAGEVVAERAINTAAGGLFALFAYASWPTWERLQVSEAMAEMFDRSRQYFREVANLVGGAAVDPGNLDELRDNWRQARVEVEASVDRVASEPGIDGRRLEALYSMLASSHACLRVVMEVEARISAGAHRTIDSAAFEKFTRDVEFTWYFLAAALRGSRSAARLLPDLREDHRRLIEEAANDSQGSHDYLLKETDRLTSSLNTLKEQVLRYLTPTARG